MKKGFTLIELAIVIVIIGLIVAGVVSGQALVEQTKLMTTARMIPDYTTAITVFKGKYNRFPGDMNNASAMGLDQDASGTKNVTYTSYDSSYNGDGNGILTSHGMPFFGGMHGGEINNFWIHLSNAGLIKTTFAQTYGCNYYVGTKCDYTAGKAFPVAPIGGAMIIVPRIYSNKFQFLLGVGTSLPPGSSVNGLTEGTANTILAETLTPAQAYYFDEKFDDGKPDSGNVQVYGDWLITGNAPIEDSTLDPTDCYAEANGDYNLSVTTQVCSIYITKTIN